MGESSGLGGLIPLLLLVLLFVWFISRQRRQQREFLAVQDRVQLGSQVMTSSGVYGEVVGVRDDGTIDLEVAPGVRIRWQRQAVARVIEDDAADPAVTDDVTATADPPVDLGKDSGPPKDSG